MDALPQPINTDFFCNPPYSQLKTWIRKCYMEHVKHNVSGLMLVFAKTDMAHYFISEQFANRQILKEYKAISWGNLYSNKTIDTCLIRDKKNGS